jgi:polyferredoxin
MAKNYKWLLGSIVVAVLALGWKYPLAGFVVPLVVVAALVTSGFRGRFFCGNFCPRGSFFDTWLSRIGGHRKLPAFFRDLKFRPWVSLTLFGFLALRGSQAPGDWQHWGRVFWEMCMITTLIGIGLGLVYRPRAWCALCPVGTLQQLIGGHRYRLGIDSSCSACAACEKHCPLQLAIARDRAVGQITDRDCLKCGVCGAVCPKKAIRDPGSPARL